MADSIQERILEEVADLHGVPAGAYNIRANGQTAGRNTTANIDIVTKTDKPGIDIRIKPGTRNESVHIPVVVSASGLRRWSITISSSVRTRMWSSWQAAAFITAGTRIQSMTESTASLWERMQRSNMWRSITARVTATASAS